MRWRRCFIATGQDAANIAESHAAITYTRELPNGDFYWSITLPALIVATYGGGTGLATQRECLEMLGCYGLGKVHKFAEIALPWCWPGRPRWSRPSCMATGSARMKKWAATAPNTEKELSCQILMNVYPS